MEHKSVEVECGQRIRTKSVLLLFPNQASKLLVLTFTNSVLTGHTYVKCKTQYMTSCSDNVKSRMFTIPISLEIEHKCLLSNQKENIEAQSNRMKLN